MSSTSTSAPTQTGSAAPTSTSSNSSSVGNGGLGNLSFVILLPIIAIIAFVACCIALYTNRRRLQNLVSRRSNGPLTPSSTATLTAAEMLALQTNNPSLSSTQHPADVDAGQTGNGGRQRRRRGVRRTDSGISIRTLPAYSKEAGDEELVLVRRNTMDSLMEGEESDSDDSTLRNVPMVQTTPMPVAVTIERTDTIRASPGSAVVALPGRSSPSVPASPILHGDPPNTAPPDGPSRWETINRRGFGEAPTYLEAMSSPYPPDLEAGVPPPRIPPTLRERTSSTFRNLLGRAGIGSDPGPAHIRSASSSSLLLQPQRSRLSVISSTSGSPGRTSPSVYISSPVPNTAIRASFDMSTIPRAGLSDDQMRFLASHEALNQVGVNLSSPPPGKRRRRSDATLLEDISPGRSRSGSSVIEEERPPPPWDEERQDIVEDCPPQVASVPEPPTARVSSAPAAVSAAPSSAPDLAIEPPTPIASTPRDGYFPRPEAGVPNRP